MSTGQHRLPSASRSHPTARSGRPGPTRTVEWRAGHLGSTGWQPLDGYAASWDGCFRFTASTGACSSPTLSDLLRGHLWVGLLPPSLRVTMPGSARSSPLRCSSTSRDRTARSRQDVGGTDRRRYDTVQPRRRPSLFGWRDGEWDSAGPRPTSSAPSDLGVRPRLTMSSKADHLDGSL